MTYPLLGFIVFIVAVLAFFIGFALSIGDQRHQRFMAACTAVSHDASKCEFRWQELRAGCDGDTTMIVIPQQ